jgi:hypothetical protein
VLSEHDCVATFQNFKFAKKYCQLVTNFSLNLNYRHLISQPYQKMALNIYSIPFVASKAKKRVLLLTKTLNKFVPLQFFARVRSLRAVYILK